MVGSYVCDEFLWAENLLRFWSKQESLDSLRPPLSKDTSKKSLYLQRPCPKDQDELYAALGPMSPRSWAGARLPLLDLPSTVPVSMRGKGEQVYVFEEKYV